MATLANTEEGTHSDGSAGAGGGLIPVTMMGHIVSAWAAEFGAVALASVVGALAVPYAVAKRRYRAMGIRVAFTLSIYTVCFLSFLLILQSHSFATSVPHNEGSARSSWVESIRTEAFVLIVVLHACVYAYHLASGFTWHMQPAFVYGVSLPGYCFFLAIVLFVPGFVLVRLSSVAFSALSPSPTWWRTSWMNEMLDNHQSPLFDEMILVFLFSIFFTWSIVYHQAGLPPLEVVELYIDRSKSHSTLRCLPVLRHPYDRSRDSVNEPFSEPSTRTFTVCQISDPHIGLFVSARELRSICEEAVALKPTFIFLTGDYFAAEVQRVASAMQKLKWALEPLSSPDVKAFACLGNHDYEGLPLIQAVLDSLGIRLLRDESEIVETECGTFQVIGTHFIYSQRRKGEHLQKICSKFPAMRTPANSTTERDGEVDADGTASPKSDHTIRLMLVHDPQGLDFVDQDERVLAFAGHNHGGQIGLETFGIRWTLPRAVFPTFTDLGLWTKGRNYWYVHRGTGQHAFPFRWGVRRERSLLKVTIQD